MLLRAVLLRELRAETHVDLTETPANLPEFYLPVLAVEQLRERPGPQMPLSANTSIRPSLTERRYKGFFPKRLALQNTRFCDLMFSYSYHKMCVQCLNMEEYWDQPIYEPKLGQLLTAAP